MSAEIPSTRTFGINNFKQWLHVIITIGCTVFSTAILYILWPQTFLLDWETFFRMLPLLFIGSSASFLFSSLYALIEAPHITITDSTLHYQSRWRNQMWQWNEITAVTVDSIREVGSQEDVTRLEGVYRFYIDDNVVLKLNSTIVDSWDLYMAATQYVTQGDQESRFHELRLGKTLTIGHIQLSRLQIEFNPIVLPISEVADIRITDRYLTIYLNTQKEPCARFPLRSFHNPWLFRDLVYRLKNDQRNQLNRV